MDHPDRNCVQKMQLLPAGPACDDEIGIFENPEMLHDAKACHRELGLQVLQRTAVTQKEEIQEKAARRVGKRLEYEIVCHLRDNR